MGFFEARTEKEYSAECERLPATVEDTPFAYRKFLASYYPSANVRRTYLQSIGIEFADDASFANPGFTVVPNSPSDVRVRIGWHVSIATSVTCICDSCANNGDEVNRFRYVAEKLTRKADVVIEDEAWIGTTATILPGVCIGRCAVIGAGCVMTKHAESCGIYAGVPGRKISDIRKREDGFERQ